MIKGNPFPIFSAFRKPSYGLLICLKWFQAWHFLLLFIYLFFRELHDLIRDKYPFSTFKAGLPSVIIKVHSELIFKKCMLQSLLTQVDLTDPDICFFRASLEG